MFRRLFLFFLFTAFIFGCKTQPAPIPDNISAEGLLQMAQESIVKNNNNDHAVYYYTEFISRYESSPELAGRVVEAEYEIAYIYFSEKKYSESKIICDSILEKFHNDPEEKLPRWPLVLINKILPEIEEKLSVNESKINDTEKSSD